MLTSGTATVIALVTLTVSFLIGILVGGVMCFLLRLSWGVKTITLDALIAAVLAVASAFAYSAIAVSRGKLNSGVLWIILTATTGVAIRHIVRAISHGRVAH